MGISKTGAFFAMVASGYFTLHWYREWVGSSGGDGAGSALPTRKGVGGDLLSATPDDDFKSAMKFMHGERQSFVRKLRSGAEKAPVVAKGSDLGPIGERVAVIRELVRRYSGADRRAMKSEQHAAIVANLREVAASVLTKQCKPANPKTGDGGWCINEKDWEKECATLHNLYRSLVRYTRDPYFVDTFSAPDRTLKTRAGDCLPAGTLLLTKARGYQPIELLREGDEVQGDGVWTKVTRWWDKGALPTLTFKLNNGSVLTCTAEHRLFVVPQVKGTTGMVPGAREEAIEMRAGDVKPGDELLLADVQPAGVRSLDPELAWLIGTFVADGWIDGDRVSIAGRDRVEDREYGKKDKGPQKDRIAALCTSRGIASYRTEKDIRFRDAELHDLLSRCGKGAINKQLPFIDVDAPTARAMLDGLMADASTSKTGTVVFSTISPTLALQIRALHRILGVRTNIRRVAKHGGFGSNPIFRVSVVRPTNAVGRRGMLHGKVEEIAQGGERQVYDIETDSHRFYLPETDLIVHNCDDSAITLGSMLSLVGAAVKFRVVQTVNESTWSHIYMLVSADGSGKKWVACDTTMPHGFGWEVPGAKESSRDGKPHGMVIRVVDFEL